ncbi:uncharacterized protein LOC111637164 [Centruroides sculpturatus]|uniref:uncharacterized protein LOC111637164 n=1 Tax=Centruroides sculpturatus TaxID=218467 RepID=UPI000C6D7361|nr:uncharacterized protein LOC111637164 [Centruroides sculpturatus]
MKYFLFAVVLILAYVHYSSAGSCYCYSRAGTYCGFQREHGFIGGDCTRDNMYICYGPHGSTAGWDGRCRQGICRGSLPAGRDYCEHGNSRTKKRSIGIMPNITI